MTKAKATLSLDPHTYEKAKSTFESVSSKVDELLKRELDASQIENIDLLKEEVNQINEEIEEKRKTIDTKKSEVEQLESEKTAIKSKIERKKAKKKEIQDELERFKETFQTQYAEDDGWNKPEEIHSHWPNELEKSKEELWEIGTEVIE